MGIVYPLGVPLTFLLLLCKNRRALNPKRHQGKTLAEKLAIRDKDHSIKHMAFLFYAYKPGVWWFEAYESWRRLLMTGGLVFIDQGSVLQVQCGLLITFMSVAMLCWFKPYVAKRDNWLACFQQVNQFLILSIVLLMTTKDSSKENMALSYAMIILYTACAISMIIIGGFNILEEYKGGSRQLDLTDLLNIELQKQGEPEFQEQRDSEAFEKVNPLAGAKEKLKKDIAIDDTNVGVRRRQDTEGNDMVGL